VQNSSLGGLGYCLVHDHFAARHERDKQAVAWDCAKREQYK